MAAPVAEQAPAHEAGRAGGGVGLVRVLACPRCRLRGRQLSGQRHFLLRCQQVGILQHTKQADVDPCRPPAYCIAQEGRRLQSSRQVDDASSP